MEWDPPDTWRSMAAWLGGLAGSLGVFPKAIVVVSGHWEQKEVSLTGSPYPPLIYDYSGFPPHTYQLRYPAPGSPALAQQIAGLLQHAGIPARIDSERGFDHGVFIPLKVIYPEAQTPIVQLSLQAGLDPRTHLEIGHALAPLRQQDVLIVGSGMSYHNLRGFGDQFGPASDQFDGWLTGCGHCSQRATAKPKAATMANRSSRAPGAFPGGTSAAADGGRRRCRRGPWAQNLYRPGHGGASLGLSVRSNLLEGLSLRAVSSLRES